MVKVIFFGTPAFAVPTLEALLASSHRTVAVVTQPDRPRGRGQKTTDAPVKAVAISRGLTVFQPEQLKDVEFLTALRSLEPDLGVVAAYGRILPQSLLSLPRLGMLNVHASLLPRYRGASPVHRAVIAGDHETGVTIMRVVKALDAGPMLATATRVIRGSETSEEVEADLATIGARLLVDVVDRLEGGAVVEVAQDDSAATLAPRLTKEDGRIDWALAATRIHDLVRGLYPWPHAFSFLDGHRYVLLKTQVLPGRHSPGSHIEPGTVIAASGDQLVVATGDGCVGVTLVQPEGKRALTTREFLSGYRVSVGDRFVATP